MNYKKFSFKVIVLICCIISLLNCAREEVDEFSQIEALVTFSKVYGYVKYFYPGDEAASLDWDAFAIHGANRIKKVKNKKELENVLTELFSPIAPGLSIHLEDSFSVEKKYINVDGNLDTVFWQHKGNGFGRLPGYYSSVRVNRDAMVQPNRGNAFVFFELDTTSLKGKLVKWEGYIKTSLGSATSFAIVWPSLQLKDLGYSYTGAMKNFTNFQWEKHSFEVFIPNNTVGISIDLGVFGIGSVYYDSIKISVQDKGEWEIIHEEMFDSIPGIVPKNISMVTGWYSKHKGQNLYGIQLVNGALRVSSDSLHTEYRTLFPERPKFGDKLNCRIGSGLNITMPTVLLGDSLHVYPLAPHNLYEKLVNELNGYRFEVENLPEEARIGNIINAWNVFQHFYPYFEYLDINWEDELKQSLNRTLVDSSSKDFLNTLKLLVSKLQDGHGEVIRYGLDESRFSPPVEFGYVQDKIIVENSYLDSLNLKEGDIVRSINGSNALDIFKEKRKFNLKSTDDHTNRVTAWFLVQGQYKEEALLEVERSDSIFKVIVPLTFDLDVAVYKYGSRNPNKRIDYVNKDIGYVNLTTTNYEMFLENIDSLQNLGTIIYDLRGYPNGTISRFLAHIMNVPDTSKWLRVPKVIYPDRKFSGFIENGWQLDTLKPKISSRNIFLINDETVSYGESIVGFISNYKLGTLVGSRTAGINGDVNPFYLPGSYRIRWTGSEVVKHDGSRLFGIGFEPDVPVKRTIKGIREGKDEVLEMAIELARK